MCLLSQQEDLSSGFLSHTEVCKKESRVSLEGQMNAFAEMFYFMKEKCV